MGNIISTPTGHLLAGCFNLCITVFSKGFSEDLGRVDPLFNGDGCKSIVLWGLTYMSVYNRAHLVPAVDLAFALEKLYYVQRWIVWLATKGSDLPWLMRTDPLSALFFAGYGAGDFLFMLFFLYCARKHRQNLFGSLKSTSSQQSTALGSAQQGQAVI